MEVAHEAHDALSTRIQREDEAARALYVLLFGVAVGLALAGTFCIYKYYGGCTLSLWFISLTLILSMAAVIVSLLDSVRKGILVPAVLWAYTTFLCWYAILSSPNRECNPTADTDSLWSTKKLLAEVIIVIFTALVLTYCSWTGVSIMGIFSFQDRPQGTPTNGKLLTRILRGEDEPLTGKKAAAVEDPLLDDGDDEALTPEDTSCCAGGKHPELDEPAEELAFFHTLMLVAALYFAMVLTSWGNFDGSPEDTSHRVMALTSVGIKFTVVLLCFMYYGLVCKVAIKEIADGA
mmetsp:Transcript_7099/g.20547  ORF Transcript_7099/g.20547 Transcript_7099/m.20547 type:complete len:292 (-) Transcript_7099:314-1189(-)